MTEQQTTVDLEAKSPTEAKIDKKEEQEEQPKPLTNERANKQINKRPRYPPRAPGLVPPTLDIVITMTLQFIITLISLLTILSSASVASDRDDVYWIIILEIIFTYSGFALFTHYIKRNIVVYNKFYKKMGEWQYRRLEAISNGDSSWALLWCLLVRFVFHMYIILIFPVVIIWSMWQSFRFYQDRRKNAHSEDGHTQKTDKRVYSIWALGILSKQASMITLFIQDIPLMVICGIIGNWFFFVIYMLAIVQKLIFWMKYIYDIGKCRMFYDQADYTKHFGMKAMLIEYSEILKCYDVFALPYSKREMELATLQEGDWIGIWVGKEELTDDTELNDDNFKVMIVYKNKHFKETDNLVCVDFFGIPIGSLDDYFEGRTKKLMVPPENFHTINRWDYDLHLTLLNDDMYELYHDNGEENGDNGDENDIKENDRTNVIESDGNKNGAELHTEIKSNENGIEVTNGVYNDTADGSNGAVTIDMKEKEDMNDGVIANNVNNNEENVVAEANSNKETQVENEDIVNDKSQSVVDDIIPDDIENHETDKLNDSPVVIDVEDVNEEENDHGHGGSGDEYVPVPLTANDEMNENEP